MMGMIINLMIISLRLMTLWFLKTKLKQKKQSFFLKNYYNIFINILFKNKFPKKILNFRFFGQRNIWLSSKVYLIGH